MMMLGPMKPNSSGSKPLHSLAPLALCMATLVGCAPVEDPAESTTPADDACEHASEGPFEDVTAVVEGEEPADVSAEHTAYVVTTADLMDAQQNRGGRVSFASAVAGDYFVFLSDHADLSVYDASGAEVSLEDSVHDVAECTEVSMYHLVELGVGTYTLELGPTSLEEVTLVIVPGGAHDHEEEGEG